MTSISIVVNWTGPYSFESACNLTDKGIYLIFGRNKRGKNPEFSKVLYCGITERDIGKRIAEHYNEAYNHYNNKWWIGRVVFPIFNTRDHLESVEWILSYFSGTEHNIRKTQNPPKNEIYLINEWYFVNERKRIRNVDIIKHISDVVCWSPLTRLVREGNLRTWEHE